MGMLLAVMSSPGLKVGHGLRLKLDSVHFLGFASSPWPHTHKNAIVGLLALEVVTWV